MPQFGELPGAFLLTHLVRQAEAAVRISQMRGPIHLSPTRTIWQDRPEHVPCRKRYISFNAYMQSKLANLMFSKHARLAAARWRSVMRTHCTWRCRLRDQHELLSSSTE